MRDGTQELAKICGEIHRLISHLPLRFGRDGLNDPPLPNAGIYFIYEKREIILDKAIPTHGSGNRIVRVGTHTDGKKPTPRTLRARLRSDHFGGNREGSIQRKYVGAALLKRDGCSPDEIACWKRKRKGNPDFKNALNTRYEELVSRYFSLEMPYRCMSVPKENVRLHLERRIIATIAQCPLCRASPSWLGRRCYKQAVRDSELWNSQYTKSEEFVTDADLTMLSQALAD